MFQLDMMVEPKNYGDTLKFHSGLNAKESNERTNPPRLYKWDWMILFRNQGFSERQIHLKRA